MKVIIMAGGQQKRYAPPTPKHFIRIDGERIIERSIRLFAGIGDAWVISADPAYAYLAGLGCTLSPPSETTHELSKFMSSFDAWKEDSEVLFIYGDSYLTDGCAERIRTARPDTDFTFFGLHGEMLALWLHGSMFPKFAKAVAYVKELEDRHEGGLCGSWTLYRLLLGKDLMEHRHYTNFVRIRDESIDFDAESTLIAWLAQYPNHTGSIV